MLTARLTDRMSGKCLRRKTTDFQARGTHFTQHSDIRGIDSDFWDICIIIYYISRDIPSLCTLKPFRTEAFREIDELIRSVERKERQDKESLERAPLM